ncbi:single-stranded DNA-binding protein [Enterococcus faecalis]
MINQTVLVGRLTKEPDLRYTNSGQAVATFTLAVNRNFKNQNGEHEADFINCVIWRKPAETMSNYAHKGTLLGVVGRIQTRSYENQQGQRVYVTEVVCENFQLLERKAKDQSNAQTNQNAADGILNKSEGRIPTSNQNNGFKTQNNQPSMPGLSEHGFHTPPFTGNGSNMPDDGLPF